MDDAGEEAAKLSYSFFSVAVVLFTQVCGNISPLVVQQKQVERHIEIHHVHTKYLQNSVVKEPFAVTLLIVPRRSSLKREFNLHVCVVVSSDSP